MRPLLLVPLALLLSACGASSQAVAPPVTVTVPAPTTAAPVPPTAAVTAEGVPEPANPVPILKKITGCVLEDGTVSGSVDINGNRYANCRLHEGDPGNQKDVTARTYPGDPDVYSGEKFYSSDSSKFIVGPAFVVMVTPATGVRISDEGLAQMAELVGGKVVPPQP